MEEEEKQDRSVADVPKPPYVRDSGDKKKADQANYCSQCGQPLEEGEHRHPGKTKGRGEKWASRLKIWGGAMSGLFSILFYIFFFSLFLGGGSGLFGGGRAAPAQELYGTGEDKIGVVDISGLIIEQDPGDSLGLAGGSATTLRGLIRTLEDVKDDEKIKAVVVRVNSPGGSVAASEEIYQLLKRFKGDTGLPLIVSQGDTAASGGYYVSLAGDTIIADPNTLTGSIGAIIQSVNVKDLADRLGVRGVVIASGENKDLLNPLEEPEEEEREILQRLVDNSRSQFLTRILENRDIQRSRLEVIADGRVLSGEQAQQEGLVDRLGTFDDAITIAEERAGITEATVVEFGRKGLLEGLLGAFATRLNPTANFPFLPLTILNSTPSYLYVRN